MAAVSPVFALCDTVRQTAFDLHRYLRWGHLEKVYENGLAHRLRRQGLQVDQQFPLQVLDENGTALGSYYVDLLVEVVPDCEAQGLPRIHRRTRRPTPGLSSSLPH